MWERVVQSDLTIKKLPRFRAKILKLLNKANSFDVLLKSWCFLPNRTTSRLHILPDVDSFSRRADHKAVLSFSHTRRGTNITQTSLVTWNVNEDTELLTCL